MSSLLRHTRTQRIAVTVLTMTMVCVTAPLAATAGIDRARPRTTNQQLLALETKDIHTAAVQLTVSLPGTQGAPAPIAPTKLFRTPLSSHQVFGFIGGAGFSGVTPAELTDVSTLVTNAVEIGAKGSLVESGPGWNDLNDPAFPSFVTAAHEAGDRVLLDVSSESLPTIARILRSPTASASKLATELAPILTADHLDGVDLDVEGRVVTQRSHFLTYVTVFTHRLKGINRTSAVVLNTFPQSASDRSDFFNVPALARRVDDIFVMAYDMVENGIASPNAPLASPVLGLSDVQALIDYTKVVPPSKLILGIPFYGYDFPTVSKIPGARSTGPAESVSVGNVVAVGRKALWDPASETPFYAFTRTGKWHQTWFEDPVSVGLKTAVAAEFHLAGVGAWSLGQEGDEDALLGALDGGAPPIRQVLSS